MRQFRKAKIQDEKIEAVREELLNDGFNIIGDQITPYIIFHKYKVAEYVSEEEYNASQNSIFNYLLKSEQEDKEEIPFKFRVKPGYEIDLEKSDLSQGLIVQKKIKKETVQWEDVVKGGFFISNLAEIKELEGRLEREDIDETDKNLFAYKEWAEDALLLAQLSQLYKHYKDREDEEAEDDGLVYRVGKDGIDSKASPFVFKSEKWARKFLNEQEHTIEKLKVLKF